MYKYLLISLIFYVQLVLGINLNTFYGDYEITEPVLVELINDPLMQRLKLVRQYGIDYYALKKQDYDRFEHSIGVFLLARKYGASLEEQIASLLHDVSHTAFSHLADFMFKNNDFKNSYQDDIHESFLKNSSLEKILNKHGFKISDIYHKNKNFKILEADIPDICADRLEYNLFGGLIDDIITQEDIKIILADLKYASGVWYFTDINIAKKFANISLVLTKTRWACPDNSMRNIFGSALLARAFKINLIKIDDFLLSTDDIIWQKLINSDDDEIKITLKKIFNLKDYFKVDQENFDLKLKSKFRGIDPLVKKNGEFLRLTSLDSDYFTNYNELKEEVAKGFCIKYIN